MKTKTLFLATILAAAALTSDAHARYVLTLQQTGANVVASGSGSLNLTALTPAGQVSYGSYIGTSSGFASVGYSPIQDSYSGITGPAAFGSGGFRTADVLSGSFASLYGRQGTLQVFAGYVSGSAMSGTATYNNVTFDTLAFTPGTYTYTWDTGANADSFVVTSVVPEPSTWAFVTAGAGLLGFATLRRRTAARA